MIVLLVFGSLLFSPVYGESVQKGTARIVYFNKIFGHLSRHPYANSSTLTILDCNTPMTIVEDGEKKKKTGQWYHLTVGVYRGYIKESNLSFSPVECFQKKYPHFFGAIKIEPGEQYHWGRLYDRYEQARTRVP